MDPIYEVFGSDSEGGLPVLLTTDERQARERAAHIRESPQDAGGPGPFPSDGRRRQLVRACVVRWRGGLPEALACYCPECRKEEGEPPFQPFGLWNGPSQAPQTAAKGD